MCKRIWVQELERVPQLHQMDAQATATSEKAGGQPGPKLWLRLSNSADGPSPLSPTLRFQVLRCSPWGSPPGLGTAQFSPSQPRLEVIDAASS